MKSKSVSGVSISFFILPFFLIFFLPGIKTEAATNYVPLAPIPGLTTRPSADFVGPMPEVTLASYLRNLYTFGIGAAVALAIIVVMWGGIEYIISVSGDGKSGGKERIQSAILGLLLALGSYIILKTINKDLLNLNFSLEPLVVEKAPVVPPNFIATSPQFAINPKDIRINDEGFAIDQNGNPILDSKNQPIYYPQGSVNGTVDYSNVDFSKGPLLLAKNSPAPTGSASFNNKQITNYGGPNDIRVNSQGYATNKDGAVIRDSSGNPIYYPQGSINGGVSYDEPGSVSGRLLRTRDPNTEFYSAYPLEGRTPAGLPIFRDTGTANRQLSNSYMVFSTVEGGRVKEVVTEIDDRGPSNPNALIDTSTATLNALGKNAKPSINLVPKSSYPAPGVYYRNN